MGAQIVVGHAYCHRVWNNAEIDFTVLGEVDTKTLRFKRNTPGWRLLVLDTRGEVPWKNVRPGELMIVPKGSAIVQYLTRLT